MKSCCEYSCLNEVQSKRQVSAGEKENNQRGRSPMGHEYVRV